MPAALLRSRTFRIGRYAVLVGLIAVMIVGASHREPARSAVRQIAAAGATAPVAEPAVREPRAVRKTRTHHGRASRSHHRRASRSHRRTGWVRPVRGRVSSGFGPRWGSFHPGIDIAARYGRKVHAIVGGRIVSAGWIPGYGKTVRIRHNGRTFLYPHLSRIHVRHGRVRTAAFLGRVGSTGYSTGPHLHIEIRRHGRPRNPRPILRHHGVRLGHR